MNKSRWFGLLLVFLILLVFQKAFIAQYVLWDDNALVLENPILKLPFWDALKTSFTTYYHGDYFPLTLMSYWFDVQLAGMNSTLQHVENLLLHIVAVLLLLDCFRKVTKNDNLSFLIALVFAIHPLQTETVMWISERKSLLSAVFSFLSLHFYLHSQDEEKRIWWYVLAVIFYLCAGLTKATALLLPLLFAVLDWQRFGKDFARLIKRFLPLGFLAALLMILRVQAYNSSVGADSQATWSSVYLLTVPVRAFNALGIYLGFFFWPAKSSAIYSDFVVDSFTLTSAAICGILCLGLLVYFWRKSFFTRFCWLWFFLFLLPVLQIVPRINYVNERYMYLPIIGLAGVLFYFVRPKYVVWVSGVLALVMGGLAYARSDMWITNRKLWEQTLTVMPTSQIALNNLGLDYQSTGELSKAADLYERVLHLPKDDGNKILAYNNLANIYADSRFAGFSPQKAITLLQEGIESTRRKRDTYEMRINLAGIYGATGKKEEARTLLKEVLADLEQEPDFRYQWLKPAVLQQLDAFR